MKTLANCYRHLMAKRPPGWAWMLAAFVGIVLGNAIVPAHGATLSQQMAADDSVLVALCGLAVGLGAMVFAIVSAVREAPLDPDEPDAREQRAQAMREIRRECTCSVVSLAEHRAGHRAHEEASR